MSEVKIRFFRCIHDSKEYGSSEVNIISRIFMQIEVDSQLKGNHCADVKHAPYDHTGLIGDIEVGPPIAIAGDLYLGPIDHLLFGDEAEKYYKGLLAQTTWAIHIGGKKHNGRTYNSTYLAEYEFTFEAADPSNN